ncbi:hypothetical protein Nepgr_002141 [Nepenthes gracilis]|uniref:Uncharacterized protein n=1 Tax=Nepenthes gracilis TaxID=150966 RepID=A0AAD3RWL8_NEPGR|nr:hypothetical protein Nepgr_002141 [Nepenthes gracilis]
MSISPLLATFPRIQVCSFMDFWYQKDELLGSFRFSSRYWKIWDLGCSKTERTNEMIQFTILACEYWRLVNSNCYLYVN